MKHSGRKIAALIIVFAFGMIPPSRAQLPVIDLIRGATTKVIKALDLMVQRLQNKTIWLQNAQQSLENVLSRARIDEIGYWVDKQKTLYASYFEELSKVKPFIGEYHRTKEIILMQERLIREYRQAFALFKNDKHFTTDEIRYMQEVYAGILGQSVRNMGQLQLVIESVMTQMGDADRLERINAAGRQVEQNYDAVREFNNQNKLLSLQRARDRDEANQVKAMYGIK